MALLDKCRRISDGGLMGQLLNPHSLAGDADVRGGRACNQILQQKLAFPTKN
jgi:hypothetical protein